MAEYSTLSDPNHTREQWLRPASLKQASAIQREMALRVETHDRFGAITTLGGVDVSTTRFDPENRVYAVVVNLAYPLGHGNGLRDPVEIAEATERASFPYVPGFLGFREAPAIVTAWQALAQKPDLLMVDGHGISHPRGLGIASHLGVVLDVPTIGVAKSILVGEIDGPLGPEPGDQAPLVWKGQVIGMALRTKRRANPLYIAPGHRVSLATALALVQESLRGYRLPEPTRQAHLAAGQFRLSQIRSSL